VPWGRGPRYRVERALDLISGVAAQLPLPKLASWLARPLLVEEDVRPRPFIVVLCGGCRFNGRLSESTCARVEHGVRLFDKGLAPRLILSGGRWAPHRPACAPRMKALARSLGVPADAIIAEDRSTRTAENAREVARLLRTEGARAIVLVTSALHMRRAKLCFEKKGLEVSCAPTPGIGTGRHASLVVKEVLHEYLGLAYYRVRGWI
jgi:uncharacterized SAM-binding protein YcdF (DUF218 family)